MNSMVMLILELSRTSISIGEAVEHQKNLQGY